MLPLGELRPFTCQNRHELAVGCCVVLSLLSNDLPGSSLLVRLCFLALLARVERPPKRDLMIAFGCEEAGPDARLVRREDGNAQHREFIMFI